MKLKGSARLCVVAVVATLLLASCGPQPEQPKQEKYKCEGKYMGVKISQGQLDEVLRKHEAWLRLPTKAEKDQDKEQLRANLCGADLGGVSLSGKNLSWAELGGARVSKSEWAELEGVNLASADLRKAVLNGANLKDAWLTDSDLRGASLCQSKLDHSYMNRARLAGAYLDFEPESFPNIESLAFTEDLYQAKFATLPGALVRIRDEFKKRGMYQSEKEATCAIRRTEVAKTSRLERYFNLIFFDWTCEYGMAPGRTLLILLFGIGLFTFVYLAAQRSPGAQGGIWAARNKDSVFQDPEFAQPIRLTDGFPGNSGSRGARPRLLSQMGLAFYFSLLSALRIGWHEFNIGEWLTTAQPREYSLKATGWVRLLSGVQSLISVYLLALWIVCYFGAPFE